ncbi:MAG: ATP-binding cassette domain-containing protein [Tetragenococcus sp.]|nr:ATP-binding cassette domain-containing protein [Tetragenococcus sp.]
MIELKDISVTFRQGKREIPAVKNVDLSVDQGDVYGIVGYSGAGKSTLVRVINLLQEPTEGVVEINGTDYSSLKPKELRAKRKKIGMIFQHFNLMNNRSIFDNVAFSLRYSGTTKEDRRRKVNELLDLVGLSEEINAYPSQLSGGQKQRVAIARSLANDPEILLCDEATSALDPKTTLQILSLLQKLNKQLGLTIVIITHEMQVVKEICNKVAVMEEGEIIERGGSIQIFSQPEKPLTKDFIRTATHIDQALDTILGSDSFSKLGENEWLVELSYVGDQTSKPLIAELFSQFQVTTNILYGNVEIIQDTPLGSLIVNLSGELEQRQKAFEYLKSEGVYVNILKQAEGGV